MAFSCEIPPMFYTLLNVVFYMSFSFGTGVIMIAFSDDIKAQLSVLNEINGLNKNEAQIGTKQFFEIVEFHSNAKQLRKSQFLFLFAINEYSRHLYSIFRLINDFTAIFSFMYFGYFAWTILTICDTLLILQVELVEYFIGLFLKRNFFDTQFYYRF